MVSRGYPAIGCWSKGFWLYHSTKLLAGSGGGRGRHFSLYASCILASFFWNWDVGKYRYTHCSSVGALADCIGDRLITGGVFSRSEEHTSELQSRLHLVCRLLLEKKKN